MKTLEGYAESLGKVRMLPISMRTGFFGGIDTITGIAEIKQGGFVTDAVMDFTVHGSSVQERIIFHLVTKEPEADFKKISG